MKVCLRYIVEGNTFTCDIGYHLALGGLILIGIIALSVLLVAGQSIAQWYRVRRFNRVLTIANIDPQLVRRFTREFDENGGKYKQELDRTLRGYHVPEDVIRRSYGWKP